MGKALVGCARAHLQKISKQSMSQKRLDPIEERLTRCMHTSEEDVRKEMFDNTEKYLDETVKNIDALQNGSIDSSYQCNL